MWKRFPVSKESVKFLGFGNFDLRKVSSKKVAIDKMGSGFCGNCSTTPSEIFSGSDNMVCPYCRSFRSEVVVDHSQREFTMCSQLNSSESSSPSSSFSSSSSTKNVQKLCVHSQPIPRHHQHRHHFNENHSALRNSHSAGEGVVGHSPSSVVCRCAKNQTISRLSATSTSRSNYCSLSADGWRAVRLVIFAIIFVLPSSTMSSPLHHNSRSGSPHSSGHHSHHSSPNRPMKWINPCRIPSSQPAAVHMPSQTDEEIYQNIVTQAKKAEVQARKFFDDFKEECFGKDGHDFPQVHYDWLKDVADVVNKNLGESLTPERLADLKEEEILKKMYRGLQKLAVGLEQVVLDQGIHGGSFYKHFNEAEFQLKYVLCEFQIAMMEKNIQYEDVTREIMDTNFAKLDDKTWRNFRDFTIFRDYLNTLEFIRESFEHFWKTAKQTTS